MQLSKALTMVVLLLVGFFVTAQQPKRQRDPQATFEPRSAPGAGQKFLAKFVGDWDVAKSFFRANGESIKTKGECRQTMMHDGRFLRSEFTFEQNGTKSTGTGIIGFEADLGKFTSVWFDSRRTAMSMRQSKEPFKGDEIVLYSATLDPSSRGGRQTRTVTHLEDDGRKIIHRQYALNPDGKERLMMELVMTRKAAAAQ